MQPALQASNNVLQHVVDVTRYITNVISYNFTGESKS